METENEEAFCSLIFHTWYQVGAQRNSQRLFTGAEKAMNLNRLVCCWQILELLCWMQIATASPDVDKTLNTSIARTGKTVKHVAPLFFNTVYHRIGRRMQDLHRRDTIL